MNRPARPPDFGPIRHVHMVGIGGIGMSSIAEVLLSRGFVVSGSDLHESEVTDRLSRLGAIIFEGHDPGNVEDADVVVYSSAVDAGTNPETVAADAHRIPLIKRSVMLAELMRMKFGVAIAGTHGKTTTTTLAGMVIKEGGFDPTVIVGGKVAVFGSNAVSGSGDVIVIEADEYDRTFLRLTPTIAVITTIDEDHFDIYRDLEDIKDAFVQFANSVPFFGASILCLDDENVQEIIGRIDRRVVTYGFNRQARVRAENVSKVGLHSTFDLVVDEKTVGRVALPMPGDHNIQNALAAAAVALELNMPFDEIERALGRFSGIQRRFELLIDTDDCVVVLDYAHHPAEVRATLAAARAAWPERRLFAVFQPHLYSRTRDMASEFGRSFFDADVLVVTGIYGAREAPIAGVDATLILSEAREVGQRETTLVDDVNDLPDRLNELRRPGDVMVIMGAGDIWRHAHRFSSSMSATTRSVNGRG